MQQIWGPSEPVHGGWGKKGRLVGEWGEQREKSERRMTLVNREESRTYRLNCSNSEGNEVKKRENSRAFRGKKRGKIR